MSSSQGADGRFDEIILRRSVKRRSKARIGTELLAVECSDFGRYSSSDVLRLRTFVDVALGPMIERLLHTNTDIIRIRVFTATSVLITSSQE